MKTMKVDNAHNLEACMVSSDELNIAAVCCVAKCCLAQMAQEVGLSRILCQVSSKSVWAGFHTTMIANYS
jgi:isoaspartyl peptidase/L-asparaginase-like protein (Ntn-hydrolase superfamily)